MYGSEALIRLLEYTNVKTVLDIGCGEGVQASLLHDAGKRVTTISLLPPADIVGNYNCLLFPEPFDAIWASHVLEHQPNVHDFLTKCYLDLKDDGILAITVPPHKDAIVGGHVALFNPGILIYNLILAGFDCSEARVSPLYAGAITIPYNISVIVRKKRANLPQLTYDHGDVCRLAEFFPVPAYDGFSGWFEHNW
jgi:SAM-dependent methyltransferase